ncbi:cell division protein FtsL [Aerococcus urinaeequi]|uniref:Cell division protein FtsL n=1 Tax=Aerococcus viridans TaxID=1377 RepID=A0A2N6UF56_9LACT|nr:MULTISPECIES: cell division protein FtsL [Aerococcus]OFU51328.1 cell division protein FtsL [Aerococcus sp. HMSC10H05]PMC80176.1 cell division protein FtsL [Aerococcus viridans]
MAIFLLQDQVNVRMNAMPAEKAIPNIPANPEERQQVEVKQAMTALPTSIPASKSQSKVRFSMLQKVMMTVAFLVMISGLLGVTIMRANVNAASQQLQEVQQNAEELSVQKENLTQEVHELSNYSRVVKIAEDQGLDMNEENIRNVE